MSMRPKIIFRTARPYEILDSSMSRHMRKFLRGKILLSNATHGVLAYDGQDLVGIFLYHYDPKYVELTAQGTYVERRYRRQGIGTAMWLRAHRGKSRHHTDVTTLSRDGSRFVKQLGRVLSRVEHTQLREKPR